MRILFITDILLTGDFPMRLQEEGNEVKMCILDPENRDCYKGLMNVVKDWRAELDWVGKDGLIVFDDTGFGSEQTRLRSEGYIVFGGGGDGERMETDRKFGAQIMSDYGLQTVPLHSFPTPDEAIAFIKENGGAWVIKFDEGHWLKPYAYVGEDRNGLDVISVLENYKRFDINVDIHITLQERLFGVEIGVARFFNGTKFVGPIEYNLEHTHLFADNKGPVVDEMGTLAWYTTDEMEELYCQTLKKLETFLRKSDFRGNFDVDCIVNADGAFPLEVTARLGAPIIHLQKTLQNSPWGTFLYSIAKGEDCDVSWRKGFGVVTSVMIPPFPYRDNDIGKSILGTKIHIRDKAYITKEDSVHFDEVASHDGTLDTLYIAGRNGYAFYATGVGATVSQARKKSLQAVRSVYVPRMFYRDDIGLRFEKQDLKKLKKWGYLTKVKNRSKYFLW